MSQRSGVRKTDMIFDPMPACTLCYATAGEKPRLHTGVSMEVRGQLFPEARPIWIYTARDRYVWDLRLPVQ